MYSLQLTSRLTSSCFHLLCSLSNKGNRRLCSKRNLAWLACPWPEHVSGAWAERAENRVERSGAWSGRGKKTMERERSGERTESAAHSIMYSLTIHWLHNVVRTLLQSTLSVLTVFSSCTCLVTCSNPAQPFTYRAKASPIPRHSQQDPVHLIDMHFNDCKIKINANYCQHVNLEPNLANLCIQFCYCLNHW